MNLTSAASPSIEVTGIEVGDLQVALTEIAAARAILLASTTTPTSARSHLSAAVQCTGLALWTNDGDGSNDNTERQELLIACDRIQAELERQLLRRGVRPIAKITRMRWLGRIALWTLVPLAAVILAAKPWQKKSTGPWRGAYFATNNLSGQPLIRHDPDLAFEWVREAPMDAIPGELFSVQWDTCLNLSAASTVSWQLVFDDEARLYIDGKLMIDGWKLRERHSLGGTIAMLPGVHHLRVNYIDHHGPAAAHLLASFRGEVPTSIPTKWLTLPIGEVADADPCGVDPAVAVGDIKPVTQAKAPAKAKAAPAKPAPVPIPAEPAKELDTATTD